MNNIFTWVKDNWFLAVKIRLGFMIVIPHLFYLHTLLLRRLQRKLDPTVGQSKTFLSDKCVLLRNFSAETSCEWATYFLTLLFFNFNTIIVAFTDPTVFFESTTCEDTVFLNSKAYVDSYYLRNFFCFDPFRLMYYPAWQH